MLRKSQVGEEGQGGGHEGHTAERVFRTQGPGRSTPFRGCKVTPQALGRLRTRVPHSPAVLRDPSLPEPPLPHVTWGLPGLPGTQPVARMKSPLAAVRCPRKTGEWSREGFVKDTLTGGDSCLSQERGRQEAGGGFPNRCQPHAGLAEHQVFESASLAGVGELSEGPGCGRIRQICGGNRENLCPNKECDTTGLAGLGLKPNHRKEKAGR